MGDDDGRMHVAEVVRVASAFTPAVPLRVVMLVLDSAGVTPIELDVVGCVHRVADEYRLLVPAGQSAPFPAGSRHEDLIAVGYEFDRTDESDDVLVWNDEFGCAERIDQRPGNNTRYVVGPVTRSQAWWAAAVAEATAELRADPVARRVLAGVG